MDFTFEYPDMSGMNTKLDLALELLGKNSSRPSTIFESAQEGAAFFFIAKANAYGSRLIDRSLFIKHNYDIFLSNLLAYLFDIRNELDFEGEVTHTLWDAEQSPGLNEKRLLALGSALYSLNIIIMSLVSFSLALVSSGGLKALMNLIKDEPFVKKNTETTIPLWGDRKNLVKYIVMNISSLSKWCDEKRSIWTELDSVATLLSIIILEPKTSLDACIAITNLADDKHVESLTDIHSIVDTLMDKLNTIAGHFRDDLLDRQDRELFEQNETVKCQVHIIMLEDNTSMNMLNILQALYKLCVNDKMRKDTYFGKHIKKPLLDILSKSNYFESKYALRLIAQLAFNIEISRDMANDATLKESLKRIALEFEGEESGKKNLGDFSVRNLCKQINWSFSQTTTNKVDTESKLKDSAEKKADDVPSHVMISYNTASRDLCLKVKADIEAAGHKVWIDVNDIHGSSLNSMAEAVENSYCVLICVTEKYRQSINCQAEAQYAFRINKPIVPLIMQSGYEKVKGWLGFIQGDKIFVNFTRYSYDECIRRLRSELKTTHKALTSAPSSSADLQLQSSGPVSSQPTRTTTTNPHASAILGWSESNVFEWFEKNALNRQIIKAIGKCNGVVLHQLYEMKNEAPQFFYQSLKTDQVDLDALMMFVFHLKQLF